MNTGWILNLNFSGILKTIQEQTQEIKNQSINIFFLAFDIQSSVTHVLLIAQIASNSFMHVSSKVFLDIQSVDSLWNAYVTWQKRTV